MVLPSVTSTASPVHFTYPPSSLVSFTPPSYPQALSPPISDRTLARPFNIDPELYNNALHLSVPVSIALVYAATVTYVNRINKERDYKPWAFSKSLSFWLLVITHNTLLAIFSGWTFVGMLNAIMHSWPGLDGSNGLSGAVDALCKINGPRGLGNAATYNEISSAWSIPNRALHLTADLPDTTDVGRIWNEGLAFYGWLFYLSKFYEVVDTAINLAKGKVSSDLQTFHHAGAMLCMWAGIRYMSPPIWMFVFINSGLHTIMYTYYTLTTLTIKVPRFMKQLLTTLQIVQIVFGCSYALVHLFIAYDIPVELPYLYVQNLSTALPSTASTVSSVLSSAFSSATTSAATAGMANWLKKAALRAAGEEGLAENVRNYQGEKFGIDAVHAADIQKAQQEIRYRMGTQRVHCLDTSGQVFAILLNTIYLVPLFYLFAEFFYKTYMARAEREPPKPSKQENIKESAKDAIKKTKEVMGNDQGGATEPPPETKAKLEKAKSDAKDGASKANEKVQTEAKDLGTKAQQGANDLSKQVKEKTNDFPTKLQESAQDLSSKAHSATDALPSKISNNVQESAAKAQDMASTIPAQAEEMGQQALKKASEAKQTAQDNLNTLVQNAPKLTAKENAKPNGETKAREKSPEKASKLPRGKSPEKKPLTQTQRDPSPEKKQPTSAPREKSPEKKAATPRDKSPVKPSAVAQEGEDQADEKPAQDVADGPVKEEQEEERPATIEEPAKEETEGEEKKNSPDLGASGYEMVPDEPKTEEERKAEEEMQPGVVKGEE